MYGQCAQEMTKMSLQQMRKLWNDNLTLNSKFQLSSQKSYYLLFKGIITPSNIWKNLINNVTDRLIDYSKMSLDLSTVVPTLASQPLASSESDQTGKLSQTHDGELMHVHVCTQLLVMIVWCKLEEIVLLLLV